MVNSLSENTSMEGADTAYRQATVRLRRRFRRWMLSGLLLAVLLGPYLFYRAASFQERVRVFQLAEHQLEAGDRSTRKLKIMTWNIAHGRGIAESNWAESAEPKIDRVLRIAEFIKGQDADVVVLNEVDFSVTWSGGFDQAEAIASAAGYSWYARQTNLDFGFLVGRFKFGNVILSRFPIESASAIDLPPHAGWEDWLVGRKRGLHCTIKVGDRPVDVFGLHLESRGEPTRIESVEYLNEKLQSMSRPVILAGDLNTTPFIAPTIASNPANNNVSEKGNSFDILSAKSGLSHVPESIHDASQFTFPSTSPATAIDWVFFDYRSFRPLGHRVLQTLLSDHLPVIVELQFDRTR